MKFTFKDIDEGTYNAKVFDLIKDEGPFGPFIRLIFTITEGELQNYKFSGFVKPTHLKQSKFYKWISNILGEQPDNDFDINNLIGKHCLVHLTKSGKFYSVTDVYGKNDGLINAYAVLNSLKRKINQTKANT